MKNKSQLRSKGHKLQDMRTNNRNLNCIPKYNLENEGMSV